jgi:hypothetical protein
MVIKLSKTFRMKLIQTCSLKDIIRTLFLHIQRLGSLSLL